MKHPGVVATESDGDSLSEEGPEFVRGKRIAEVLSFVWHNSPPPPSLSSGTLKSITPLLLKSGGGALGWWRVRQSGLRDTESAQDLHQAYRLHTLEAVIKEREVGDVFSFLQSRGLDPLLGKGWVIARQYPESGLRPYGDIDLYVRPEQHNVFVAALGSPEVKGWNVDLHRGAAELDERTFDELYDRSQLVRLGEVEVRTFGPEDHLRLLCLHFLREGALRPLWLCDIAVALNSLPADFDWDYFLSGNQRRSRWASCAIGLAHQLLSARVEGLPVAVTEANLPRWLVPVVLQQWGKGKVTKGRRVPMSAYLRNPAGVMKSLRERWPNPIEATVDLKGPFNDLPRLPFQIGDSLLRTLRFFLHVPQLLR
jgi:hypothetical protein